MNDLDTLRSECWDRALHAYATSHIFESRARYLRRRLRFLTFLGIAVPLTVGLVYITYGHDTWITTAVVWVASILGVVQVVLSLLSLVYKWDDDHAYALESHSANRSLFDKYRLLGRDPPMSVDVARVRFDIVVAEDNTRTPFDEKQGITDEEKRMGMRAALRQLSKACAGCGNVPQSMIPSRCAVCGDFKERRL